VKGAKVKGAKVQGTVCVFYFAYLCASVYVFFWGCFGCRFFLFFLEFIRPPLLFSRVPLSAFFFLSRSPGCSS